MKHFFASILIVLAFVLAQAQDRPMPNTYVHDFADVISADQEALIQAKAERLKNEFQTEIAVVTVNSLDGMSPFDYSMKMARSWGIGDPDEDSRGLLLLVAPNERKISFRTSRHMEGDLPDGVTGNINREMGTFFKKGQWGEGLNVGMDRILAAVQPKLTPASVAASSDGPSAWWLLLIPLAIVFILYRIAKRREETPLRTITRNETVTRPMIIPPQRPSQPTLPSRTYSRPRTSSTSPSRSSSRSSRSESSSYTPSSSSSSDYSSSSSSSSSYDSGSSYGGSSDFGGGGSDSSF